MRLPSTRTYPDGKLTFAERYGPWAVIVGASDGVGAEYARAVAA